MKADSTTGFVGNLSTGQETKLQQLWGLLLDAFDTDAEQHAEARPQSPAATGPPAPGTSPHHQVGVGERPVNHAWTGVLRQAWLDMLKQENPDALLLRFLRARKWDVARAFAMLEGALVWRHTEARIDDEVLRKGESWCAKAEKTATATIKERKDARDFLEQLRIGKVYFRGADRRGRPTGYVHVALHKPGAQSAETIEKVVVQTMETARCLFTTPSESFCVVFDMTGFSLSNMEWQPARFVIRAFEANYPECLGSMIIHNAPWVFSGVWTIVRGLLDPAIVAKVDFTNSIADLEKHIPRENIIARLGGGDDWEYRYQEPSGDDDAAIAEADTRGKIMDERRGIAEGFFAATRAWIRNETADVQQRLRSDAAQALRVNYWRLDPYVRSRTNLDRTGVIGRDGLIELYPDRKATAAKDGTGIGAGREDVAASVVVHQQVTDAGAV